MAANVQRNPSTGQDHHYRCREQTEKHILFGPWIGLFELRPLRAPPAQNVFANGGQKEQHMMRHSEHQSHQTERDDQQQGVPANLFASIIRTTHWTGFTRGGVRFERFQILVNFCNICTATLEERRLLDVCAQWSAADGVSHGALKSPTENTQITKIVYRDVFFTFILNLYQRTK